MIETVEGKMLRCTAGCTVQPRAYSVVQGTPCCAGVAPDHSPSVVELIEPIVTSTVQQSSAFSEIVLC